MYELKTKVLYSDIAEDGRAHPHQLMDFFQDCSVMDSESVGMDTLKLREEGYAWVVSSWNIEIDRYPAFGEELIVRTWPYSFDKLYGHRNFDILDGDGVEIVRADSLWLMINIEKEMPKRLTEDDMKGYILGERIDMPPMERKLPVIEEGDRLEPFRIRRMDIDTNSHVNNARYIAMAEEYLPEGVLPYSFKVMYRKAAKFGNKILPVVQKEDERLRVDLCDRDYKPYASVEFNYR